MQINFNNNTINSQVVNEYKGIELTEHLLNRDWDELESFFSTYHTDKIHDKVGMQNILELKKIVKEKDEKKLKGFIQRNKDNFFTNILSNMASSGLIMALKILVG